MAPRSIFEPCEHGPAPLGPTELEKIFQDAVRLVREVLGNFDSPFAVVCMAAGLMASRTLEVDHLGMNPERTVAQTKAIVMAGLAGGALVLTLPEEVKQQVMRESVEAFRELERKGWNQINLMQKREEPKEP